MQILETSLKLIALGLFLFSADAANAAWIQNLSPTPQTIEIENYHTNEIKTLAPGETYFLPGLMKMKWRGREARIEYNEQYVIWDDTTLSPQYRRPNRGAMNF